MITIDNSKTRAIVLQSIRYGDSSLIVKMLTEEFGLQSYMVKGVLGKNSKMKPAHFQNMNLLEIVDSSNKGSLHFIKDLSISYFYKNIHSDFKKTSIIIFISELISKSIIDSDIDKTLFRFIYDSLIWLDESESAAYINFPIIFAMKLCSYLGFSPNLETYQEGRLFDLLDGDFKSDSNSIHVIDNNLSTIFYNICKKGYENYDINLSNSIRQQLLEAIVLYYKLHVENVKDIRSHEILHTILS